MNHNLTNSWNLDKVKCITVRNTCFVMELIRYFSCVIKIKIIDIYTI